VLLAEGVPESCLLLPHLQLAPLLQRQPRCMVPRHLLLLLLLVVVVVFAGWLGRGRRC
jgi:hypothetical protein